MERELYKRAKELFLRICDLPDEDRRAALDENCAGDPELRAEVEALLRHHDPSSAETAPLSPEATTAKREEPRIRSVGPYRIIREIGRGGMGVVYVGVREGDQFKRRLAIKVLKRGTDTERVLQRFDLERQVLSALNHAGIGRLFDAGETEDGVPYFAMEYVEGIPIDEYCDVHRLHIDERLELFSKVCAAVHYAHQNLVVHRDLKPGNIIVTKDGEPKLLDFGIAKLINPEMSLVTADPTAPEFRVMTPEYASPEQVRGDPITTASDVYSLGVLLYELLSGHRPYRIKSRVRAELERIICEEDPERPSTALSRIEALDTGDPTTTKTVTPESVSRSREERIERLRRRLAGDIDNIVLMAMRKEPQRRYVSAQQLAEDIHRHLKGHPVHARRDTFGYRMAKFIRRNRGGVAAALIIVILIVAGGVTSASGWWTAVEAKRQAVAAKQEALTQRDRALQQERIAEEATALADSRLVWIKAMSRTFAPDRDEAARDPTERQSSSDWPISVTLAQLELLSGAAQDDSVLKRELALGYNRIGDIQGSIRGRSHGDLKDALASYRKALAIQQEVASRTRRDPGLLRELSLTHLRIGDMLKRIGQTQEALEAYQTALDIRQGLLQASPTDHIAQRDLAIALSNVGEMYARLGDDALAIRHYNRSLTLREQLAAQKPEDLQSKRDLSSIYLRVGGRLDASGDHEAALQRYTAALTVRQELVEAEPENIAWRRDLAVAHYFVGRAHLRLDDPEAALPHLVQYFTVMQQRVWLDPESSRARGELAGAYEIIAGTKGMMGDWEAALEDYRKLQSMMHPLVDEHPEDTLHQLLLAASYEGIANARAELGDLTGAIEPARDAVTIYEELADADPDNARWRERLPAAMLNLGIRLVKADRRGEAMQHLQAALDRYEALADRDELDATGRSGMIETMHELSKLMAKLEDGDKALEYAERAVQLVEQPTPALLRDLALAYHLTGDDERAIENATLALTLLEGEEDTEAAELREVLEADLESYRR
ncbi:MAG: protein kinase [Planctomycetota bacterium]|nr:protein kinase [Planctomycetota bacterium]